MVLVRVGNFLLHHLCIANDDREHVVEVMRNASSEVAECLDALGVLQTGFHLAKFGDVLDHRREHRIARFRWRNEVAAFKEEREISVVLARPVFRFKWTSLPKNAFDFLLVFGPVIRMDQRNPGFKPGR